MLDDFHQASLGIRTIDGLEKTGDEAVLGAAANAVARARKLFILGHGFDESNSERIGLTSLRQPGYPDRAVFFTNQGGRNRLSIAAARAMTDRYDTCLPGSDEDFESLETGCRFCMGAMQLLIGKCS